MRAGDMWGPRVDTPMMMMILWQLVWVTQINTHTRISDRTNISIFQRLDKIFTRYILWRWLLLCSQYLVSVTTVSGSLSPRHFTPRPSELCAPTNCKMFPNNNFPVSLQVSKQSQPSVTNNNRPDQIFKTRILQNSAISPAMLLLVIHYWILLLIAIHLCNLFPWLPLDSPHFARDIPRSSDVFVMSQCPVNHQPSTSAIHRKWAFDTPASQNPWK